MNKKDIGFIFALFVLIVFVIGILAGFFERKEEFEIYQEICHDEIFEFDGYECSNGIYYIGILSEEVDVENFSKENGIFCSKVYKNYSEEICGNKEVENVVIDTLKNENIIIKQTWEEICVDNYYLNKEVCDAYPRYMNISKEDIENSIVLLKLLCEEYKCRASNSYDCFYLKCGDYTVERIK